MMRLNRLRRLYNYSKCDKFIARRDEGLMLTWFCKYQLIELAGPCTYRCTEKGYLSTVMGACEYRKKGIEPYPWLKDGQ